jgi:N-acetylmuramoyl-L-alanine amidase
MSKKLIILDAGHGRETPGKRSPVWSDGSQLFEWEFNRDVVKRISKLLVKELIPNHILANTDSDIPLPERCRWVNNLSKDAILISIHANAGGGTGWECYTTKGNTAADKYAQILYDQFKIDFPEWKIRTDRTDGDDDKESQFYILKHVVCPAILSENFFMDTERDCRFIMSGSGRQRIAESHVRAIKKIVEQ